MIRKFTLSPADAGRTLADFIADRLALDPAAARARVIQGAVYIDDRRVRDPSTPLAARQRIAIHPAPESAAPAAPWRVAFESPDLLVIDKPPGLPVAAPRAGGDALDAQVAARFPGATLAHRIDRDTSGLVLFARTRAARQRIAADLAAGRLTRIYTAIVAGDPPDSLRLDSPIGPDPADPRRRRAGVPGGDPALTLARVRTRTRTPAPGRALLEVELVTGRTHQIRVHLAAAGYPILGDPLYGGPPSPRLALHAERLAWPGGAAHAPTPPDLVALLSG